jgi:phage-related protein
MANQELVITFLKGLGIALGVLLVIGTITTLLALLLNPLTLVALGIAALYTAWSTNFLGIQTITTAIVTAITEFFRANGEDIKMIFESMWAIVSSLFSIYLATIHTQVMGFVQIVTYLWKVFGDDLMNIANGAWQIIVGIVQFALAVIRTVMAFATGLITGDWTKTWQEVTKGTDMMVRSIQNILNGLVNILKGIGGAIYETMTGPFKEAWKTIEDIMKKIKDNVDFTKRHSPSVVDIVNRGVEMVNKGFANLDMGGISTSPSTTIAAGVGIGASSGAPSMTSVNIDLNGAVIADAASAMRISEIIGNGIMKKLQLGVRV